MGTGNKDVGKDLTIDAAPKPTTIASPPLAAQAARPSQGAMSEQGYGAHGNECHQQKLVHLVGYRGKYAAADSWDRLRLRQTARSGAES